MTTQREFDEFIDDDALSDRAKELLFSDVDSFAEWLRVVCIHRPRVQLGYVDTLPHRLLARCDEAETHELVALALYPDKHARNAAMEELGQRYCKAHATHLADLKAELMAGV